MHEVLNNMLPKFSRLIGPYTECTCPNCKSHNVYVVDPPRYEGEGCWLICGDCFVQSGKAATQYEASKKWRNTDTKQ